jgi:hypothetical protein
VYKKDIMLDIANSSPPLLEYIDLSDVEFIDSISRNANFVAL